MIASRLLESGVDPRLPRDQRRRPDSRIDAVTAFWLATAGGGIALDLPVGMFETGYRFDAVVIDGGARHGNLRVDERDTPENILQKIIYHAARVNIRETWVANRRVHARDGEH